MQGTKEALSKMVDNEFEHAKETALAVNDMEDILTLDKIKELDQ
jgi:hypothetical protein